MPFTDEEWLKTNLDAAIALATTAIKQVILVNGGAAIALMTLVGTNAGADLLGNKVLLSLAVAAFGIGTAAGVVAGLLGYLSQLFFFQDGRPLEGIPATEAQSRPTRLWAIVAGLIGIVCFVIGLGLSLAAILA